MRYSGNEYQFLLVQHHAGHWAFPKGHAENGETEQQAARRELREETGLRDILLLEGVTFTETYYFRRGNRTVAKTVRYFLGVVKEGTVHIQASEIKAYQWASGAEAAGLITFSESRRLLDETQQYLEQNSEQVRQLVQQIE